MIVHLYHKGSHLAMELILMQTKAFEVDIDNHLKLDKSQLNFTYKYLQELELLAQCRRHRENLSLTLCQHKPIRANPKNLGFFNSQSQPICQFDVILQFNTNLCWSYPFLN